MPIAVNSSRLNRFSGVAVLTPKSWGMSAAVTSRKFVVPDIGFIFTLGLSIAWLHEKGIAHVSFDGLRRLVKRKLQLVESKIL